MTNSLRSHGTSHSLRTCLIGAALLPLLAAIVLTPAAASAAQSCGSLTTLSLPGARITSAVVVPASGNLPANCKVNGVATPTSDSSI